MITFFLNIAASMLSELYQDCLIDKIVQNSFENFALKSFMICGDQTMK